MTNRKTETCIENGAAKGIHKINDKDSSKGRQEKLLKGSIVLNLGHYTASVWTLSIFSFVCLIAIYSVAGYPTHPLTNGLPLMDNLPLVYSLVVIYVLFCTIWGPKMMKQREPYKIKPIIRCYNAFQVVICSYLFYELGSGWINHYNYFCEPVKYVADPTEIRISSAAYLFFLTKILDLLDTVFFVLNKKWEHISFLHMVHHSSMVLNLWFMALYVPSGHMTFGMFLNSFIHALMYGYYFLSSLGPAVRPYLWWKRYLTVLQIIQICVAFLHLSQVLLNGCKMIPGMTYVSLGCASMYVILFMDFYVNAYRKKTDNQKQNGGVTINISSSSRSAETIPLAHILSAAIDLQPNVDRMKEFKMM